MKQSMKRCSTSIFRSLTCTRVAGLKSDRHRFHPFLTIVVRNFGIADTLMDKSTELMGNSKEKQFKDIQEVMKKIMTKEGFIYEEVEKPCKSKRKGKKANA